MSRNVRFQLRKSSLAMAKTFKKIKLKKALGKEKEMEKPKARALKYRMGHRAEVGDVDKIFYCLSMGNRRRTGYRKILGLDTKALESNIYLISEKLLEIIVSFQPTDKLFYRALRRLVSLRNGNAIHQLLFDYFQAAVLCQADYGPLGSFIIRNAPSVFTDNREAVKTFLKEEQLLMEICGLREVSSCAEADFTNRICLLRSGCIVDQ
jgi:hypothetical protein